MKHHALAQTPEEGIRAWLLQVCEAKAAALRRGRRRRKRTERDWKVIRGQQTAFPSPEGPLLRRQDLQVVKSLLGELEPARRAVITEYAVKGHSIRRVAKKLRIPKATAYNRLRLAYADLEAAGRRLTAAQKPPKCPRPKRP